jgi:hypothetical protein
VNNIKMDLREMGWDDWIDLAQDGNHWRALVNTVMNLRGNSSVATKLAASKKGSATLIN